MGLKKQLQLSLLAEWVEVFLGISTVDLDISSLLLLSRTLRSF